MRRMIKNYEAEEINFLHFRKNTEAAHQKFK